MSRERRCGSRSRTCRDAPSPTSNRKKATTVNSLVLTLFSVSTGGVAWIAWRPFPLFSVIEVLPARREPGNEALQHYSNNSPTKHAPPRSQWLRCPHVNRRFQVFSSRSLPLAPPFSLNRTQEVSGSTPLSSTPRKAPKNADYGCFGAFSFPAFSQAFPKKDRQSCRILQILAQKCTLCVPSVKPDYGLAPSTSHKMYSTINNDSLINTTRCVQLPSSEPRVNALSL